MKNVFYGMIVWMVCQMVIGCSGNGSQSDVKTDKPNVVEAFNKELDNDYEAWFRLPGKYVETFRLQIKEVPYSTYSWNGQPKYETFTVAFVENLTDNQRGAFFVTPVIGEKIFLPLNALNELIKVLEDIMQQTQHDACLYNCNRQYITSAGTNIVFHYSSETKKWDEVRVYYTDNAQEIEIKYLPGYIEGLKECAQSMEDFKSGKWDNKQ